VQEREKRTRKKKKYKNLRHYNCQRHDDIKSNSNDLVGLESEDGEEGDNGRKIKKLNNDESDTGVEVNVNIESSSNETSNNRKEK
jgi:hypothetical protein